MSETPLIHDELDLLAELVPLQGIRLIELGCGKARLASALLARYPQTEVTALEVDERQHAKNLAAPQSRLNFVQAGAQAIPFANGCFDGAMMLKSLHHVPIPLMDQALGEVARVLRPGGWFYVSEPVYAGPLNDIMRLVHDEGEVRLAAQQALDKTLHKGTWEAAGEHRFEMPVHFADFADFEQRMLQVTYADRRMDGPTRQEIRQRFDALMGPQGVFLTRPMHVRLLRKPVESLGKAVN
jgi:SAM-dependent methyltransferase